MRKIGFTSFRRLAVLSLCTAAFCVVGLATSLTSVSAMTGSNSCSQSGTTGAACSVSTPAGTNGPATAAGIATSTLDTPGGRLQATSDGFGLSSTATASASYSNFLIVTGATGSGDLTITFTGFQDILSNSPAGGSVSPLLVTVGTHSAQATIPFTVPPAQFSVVVPVDFGVVLPFSFSFSDTANGTILQGGILARGDADAVILSIPTFAVTNANGQPSPGTVQFAPEPATWALLVCAIPGVWLAHRRALRARA